MLIEVVCCSLEECVAAQDAGVDRIELCSTIDVGGLTPSLELLRDAKAAVQIPVMAMVRPREGDSHYSDDELLKMREDAVELAREGADGLVLGCLTEHGTVDMDACLRMIDRLEGVDLVFHKAIDATPDVHEAAKVVAAMGFTRILTSGGYATALQGAESLARLVRETSIQILAGGGIRAVNVQDVVRISAVSQVHFAAFKGNDEGRIERGKREIGAVKAALPNRGSVVG